MLYDITDPKFRAAVLAFMLARKAAARRADLESEIDRVKRRMEQRRIHAMSEPARPVQLCRRRVKREKARAAQLRQVERQYHLRVPAR